MEKSVLAKGLRILQYLVDSAQGQSLSEIARAQGLPVSTTHRMLSVLESTGWVSRSASGTYRLGNQILLATEAIRNSVGIPDVHDVLTDLARKVNETVLLGTLVGQKIIYLDVIHGPEGLGIKGVVGQRGPLHCTSLGKSILSVLPVDALEPLIESLDLPQFTPNTITSKDRLRSEIQQCTERGYATNLEENEIGAVSVGVPVVWGTDPDGFYAISISAPSSRTDQARRAEFLSELNRTRSLLLRTTGGNV